MRKGRGHDDTTIKRSQRRGGKMVVTVVTMTMTMKTTTTTMMNLRSDRGCGGGEWRVANSGNGSGSGDERMLRYDYMAPPLNSYIASVCMCS